jgi:predicted  nucleic acid-binding Zn-ribbon protein
MPYNRLQVQPRRVYVSRIPRGESSTRGSPGCPERPVVLTQAMAPTRELLLLQEVDSALDSSRASLADAESRMGESDDVAALRARVTELRAAARDAEAVQKDVDLEADALRTKIAGEEAKLYSGSIKNPKELKDLQEEVDQLKRHLSAVEDRELEAMSAVDGATTELRTTETELSEAETPWRDEQADLATSIEKLRLEIAEHEASRTTHAANIAPDLLRTYDRLRASHQGRGVAKLDRNLCMGCRISLPVNLVNRARAGTTLAQCPNCERILIA